MLRSTALAAAPSTCNAYGNGVVALRRVATARLLRVTGASHCHFEVPLDATCTAICGGTSDAVEVARIQGVILGLATAAALGEAAPWWHRDGAALSMLQEAGWVQVVLPAP